MTEQPRRPEPPTAGSEREQLNGFLDFLRATVVWKCAGLTDEQARKSHVPSKLTTIAGLLAHLRFVEEYWFSIVLDGQEDRWKEVLAEDPDAEFRSALDAPLERLLAEYEAQCRLSREVTAELDLEAELPFRNRTINPRYVLVHMIEETARHAGHLDLLRELTDGREGGVTPAPGVVPVGSRHGPIRKPLRCESSSCTPTENVTAPVAAWPP